MSSALKTFIVLPEPSVSALLLYNKRRLPLSGNKVNVLFVVVCLISTLTCTNLERKADNAASLAGSDDDPDNHVVWVASISALDMV